MTADSRTDASGASGSSPSPEELRKQVEGTREELGRTVQALASKADGKAIAQEKTQQARQAAVEHRKPLVGTAAATVGAALAYVVVRRRRHAR